MFRKAYHPLIKDCAHIVGASSMDLSSPLLQMLPEEKQVLLEEKR